MAWLKLTDWHYALRLKCDVLIHGVNRHPIEVGKLYPLMNQAKLFTNVGLWTDGIHRANLVLATVKGAKDSWAVITDEVPSLQYLRGVVNKGRALLVPIPLFSKDPEPCFASKKAQLDFYDSIWFERIVTINCKT